MIEARETMHGIESDGLLLRLYVLNGVRSAPRFLDGLNGTLAARLSALGCEVRSRVLFPYGDWHRRLLPQIREARFDIMLPYRRYGRSIGGGRTLVALDRDRSEPEGDMGGSDSGRRREKAEAETGAVQTDHALAANGERTSDRRKEIAVFVGHSAGGVAAVHASGLLLAREGGLPSPVVMIGSPKCRIPGPLRDAVLYVQSERTLESRGAANRSKTPASARTGMPAASKTADPICRIGSFGGWGRNAGRLLPGWRGDLHAPGARAAVRIAGGHADYFRDRSPYLSEEGRTNMEETLAALWPWLTERLTERAR